MTLRAAVCAVLTLAAFFSTPTRADDCKKLTGLWLDLTRTSDGYLVPMTVNGTARLFELNLRLPYAILDSNVVETLKLPIKRPRFTILYGGTTVKKIATAQTIQCVAREFPDHSKLGTGASPSRGPRGDAPKAVNHENCLPATK
ncbi:MAG: hypothetical protein KGJ78_11985 [Alphaproteobacteria bacterium]|nr:hypothetical protein [Alphaproteobacteria bacterium]